VQALNRIGFIGAIAMLSVLATSQVVPSKPVITTKGTQSFLPDAKNQRVSHKPDAQESKQLLQTRADRTRGYIENKGQWPSDVKFLGRSNGLDLWVTNEGLRFNAYSKSSSKVQGHVVGVKFVGSKGLAPVGHDEVGVLTDFINKARTAQSAKTYRTVASSNLYPGVQLKNYFDGSRPRYDLVVAPNANASQIKMAYIASKGITVKPQSLAIKTSVGSIVESKLLAYQMIDGKKKIVDAAFRQTGQNQVGFKLGKYDHSKQLVIDPVLVYGSYYGGDSGMDEVHAIISDLVGGIYMTGRTRAADFPRIFGPYSFNLSGGWDAFVSKLEGDAYRHDYAAFVGGSKDDSGDFLQIDQFGDLWVAGYTASQDFPGQNGDNVQYIAYDYNRSQSPTPGGALNVDANGQPLPWSRPLTGSNAHFRVRLAQMTNVWSPPIRWDVDAATFQTALQAYINVQAPGNTVTVTAEGATIADKRGYKIAFHHTSGQTSPVRGELEVDSNELGAVYTVTRSADGRAQVITPSSPQTLPTTGAFTLSVPYTRGSGSFVGTTVGIPFSASAPVIQNALNSLPADPADPNQTPVNMHALVRPDNQAFTGQLPASGMIMLFPTPEPHVTVNQGSMDVNYINTTAFIDEFAWDTNSAPPSGAAPGFPPPIPDPDPNGAAFNLAYGGVWTSPTVRFNSNPLQLETAIGSAGTPAIGTQNVVVIPDDPLQLGNNLPGTNMAAVFVKGLLGGHPAPATVTDDPVIKGTVLDVIAPTVVSEARTNPRPVYTVHSESNFYAMRFKQDAQTVLNPLPTTIFFAGGEVAPTLAGFRIIPHANPPAGDPIRLTFGGTSADPDQWVPAVINAGGPPRDIASAGFILRVNYVNNNFTVLGMGPNGSPSHYIDAAGIPVTVGGIDVDPNGNIYVAGTIAGPFGDTIDTTTATDGGGNLLWPTTAVNTVGTLRDGRLLRYWDQYARKYNSSGAITYSVLIGGDGADEGEGIAVDKNNNAYVTGISRSFNFPRTRGVYGETFTAGDVVTISKLNTSASDLIYATHMHTSGTVTPVGIAVDGRGIAYLTLIISRGTIFNPWVPTNDPNLDQGFEFVGSIPTTGDALSSTYTEASGAGDYGGTDGAILVLNASGTALLYGSYLGSTLDDVVYRPYVDQGGDIWYCGYTDTYRAYMRFARWGRRLVRFNIRTKLPTSMISPLAFRPLPDPFNNQFIGEGTQYDGFELYNTELDNYPFFWDSYRERDGFVGRLRIGLASVANVSFSPPTIPGGLGASSSGTVTLSQAAPAGGAIVTLSMPNSAPGSFDPSTDINTTTISIPAGTTQGHFAVYSQPVADNSFVDVTATYQGDFRVGRLVVIPWLQSFTVAPTDVVGGNTAIGNIQLSGVTGNSGLNVSVTSDKPAVAAPQNSPVVVPGGQSAVAFNILTTGVDFTTSVTLNASAVGLGITQPLVVHPAQIKSVTFTPNPVTSGSSVTGKVTINGQPGPDGFVVDLSVVGAPAGYTLSPNKLTFNNGNTTQTFTLTTPYETQSVIRTVSATMEQSDGYVPNTVQGQLTVQAALVTSLSLTPTTVDGGQQVSGSVSLSTAALAGGATVDLSVSPANGVVIVPSKVTIPAGQTTANFTIQTTTSVNGQTFNVTASRAGSSQTVQLTVRPLTFTLSAPDVIASGSSGSGTITLSGPAPAGGIAVHLLSDNPPILPVPSTVTIPAGQSQVNFPLVPTAVTSDQTVNVSATIGSTTHSVAITVHASQLVGMTIMPNYVLNLDTVRCTLTLDGPAPSGGLIVNLTSTNIGIASVPTQVVVPAGASSLSFSIATRRVTRVLSTTVTGTAASGGSASAVLTVHP